MFFEACRLLLAACLFYFIFHIPATLTDQVTQRCWSKYRRYPFRSLLRSREMLIGKICTPNLVIISRTGLI